jgi:hypothetical protein
MDVAGNKIKSKIKEQGFRVLIKQALLDNTSLV